MAENDDFFGPEAAKALEAKLQGHGQGRHDHRASGHGPRVHGPHNTLGTHDDEVAGEIWPQVVAFLHDTLG